MRAVRTRQVAPPVPPPGDDKAGGKTGLTTLNRLHCFEVVVEESGFKRATARLHIPQPALSYQMKHLEEELGVQLFVRRPGGVTLTDAGRLLFTHVQRVSAAIRETERAIKELPAAGELLMPIVAAAALQLFAYHAGVARGLPIDTPRNAVKVLGPT